MSIIQNTFFHKLIIITTFSVLINSLDICEGFNSTISKTDAENCLFSRAELFHACCYAEKDTKSYCVSIDNLTESSLNDIATEQNYTNLTCPGTNKKVINNCGYFGLNSPRTKDDCVNVKIPGLYCCFVTSKNDYSNTEEYSCRLLNYFAKRHKSYSSLESELDGKTKVTDVDCYSNLIKMNILLLFVYLSFFF